MKALEGSLKRLQTDYVDVYFIHWPNPDVPLGATMDAFERLRAEGRIRALGVSNFGAKEMDAARQHGVIDVLQPPVGQCCVVPVGGQHRSASHSAAEVILFQQAS